ncbi:MAG: sulfate reduction electron transfer complex DsrMKJOP subunit DsrP [Polyangiaceae bacterium]
MISLYRFTVATVGAMLRGGRSYYLWLLFLVGWIALGILAYVHQLRVGLVATNMVDQVPWGAYIANFTYLVGMAAAAVMLVIPAYVYDDHALHDVVVLGELLAVAVLTMCLMFVMVDIGRPDRFWHLIPVLGRFNWPISMLSWDVIVLNGYLALNFGITTYILFTKFKGKTPDRRKYVPFVFVAIVWAFSIHTVTAFLYSGMGARPHWNAAILAPRFLASAFAAGPSLMIVALSIIRDKMGFPVKDAALNRLRQIVAVTMLINLFFFFSEIFTELYSFKHHAASMRYLLFGLDGHTKLVPYIWTAIALDVFAVTVFMTRKLYVNATILRAACVAAVVGVWVEKGMGLVIPGFVPSPLGEIVDYTPSFTEFCVSAAIWAAGALIYTLLLKAGVPIEMGTLRMKGAEAAE